MEGQRVLQWTVNICPREEHEDSQRYCQHQAIQKRAADRTPEGPRYKMAD